MKLYADTRRKRTRQITRDLVVLAWIVFWIAAGTVTHDVIAKLAGPAESIAKQSAALRDSLGDISDQIDEVPLVGGALEEPFSTASRAADGIAGQSREQRDRFLTAALWTGLFVALAPIGAALLLYLPFRLRWMREASAALKLGRDADDLYLFALRAVATRPLSELRRVTADPGKAFASGDYEALASLELEDLGVRSGFYGRETAAKQSRNTH